MAGYAKVRLCRYVTRTQRCILRLYFGDQHRVWGHTSGKASEPLGGCHRVRRGLRGDGPLPRVLGVNFARDNLPKRLSEGCAGAPSRSLLHLTRSSLLFLPVRHYSSHKPFLHISPHICLFRRRLQRLFRRAAARCSPHPSGPPPPGAAPRALRGERRPNPRAGVARRGVPTQGDRLSSARRDPATASPP